LTKLVFRHKVGNPSRIITSLSLHNTYITFLYMYAGYRVNSSI